MIIDYSGISEVGLKRTENQDSILMETDDERKYGIFVVADGLGGLERGEEASDKVINAFRAWWDLKLPSLVKSEQDATQLINRAKEDIASLIADVNQEILSNSTEMGSMSGSTVSSVFIFDRKYVIAHMGDSRIYRGGFFKVYQLTEDHNLARSMYQSGELSKRQWKNFRDKNPLTKCVGVAKDVKPQFIEGIIDRDCVFLLCSDGVYGYMKPGRLNSFIREAKKKELEPLLSKMSDEIRRNGAGDNYTCIIARNSCDERKTND